MIAQAILSSQPTVIREVPVPPTAQLVVAAATAQAVIATAQATNSATSASTATTQAATATAQAVIATARAVSTAADRVQTGSDAADALAAQAAAEVARDAALATGRVCASTAEGIAATTTGQYFNIISAGTNDYVDLYLNNAGSAVHQKTYPSSNLVSSLVTGVDFVAAKNLYDPSVAVDGQVYSFTTGVPAASANNIISGKSAVVEGQTYTLTQPSPEVGFRNQIYMWNSGNTFLGIAVQEGATLPLAGAVSLTASQAGGTGGFRQLTFTVAIGSGVAFIATQLTAPASAHITADFTRIKNGVMLELGGTATTFEAYTTLSRPVVRTTSLPQAAQDLIPDFANVVGKNLYNAGLAADGRTLSRTTGAVSTSANDMAWGKQAVSAGRTYTLSMPSDTLVTGFYPLLFCYSSAGAFLGIDHTDSGTTGMASPPTGISWRDTNRTCTFTIPTGSTIAYVGTMAAAIAHVSADYTRVRDSIQLEEGYAPTQLVPYSTVLQNKIKTASLPDNVLGDRLLKVMKSADIVYIRSEWSPTKDMVQRMRVHTGNDYTNNDVVEFNSARLIPRNTLDADTETAYNASTTVLAVQADDAGPAKYNGTYIGAEHGPNIAITFTATAHGKTVVDVGSEWTDGVSRKWYIVRVPSANSLIVVSENTGASDKWTFASSISGTTLTHSLGATNTSAITLSSPVLGQLYPCVKNRTKTLLLDKRTVVKKDGVYFCGFLDITESYDIINPAALITWLKTQVGSTSQPQLNSPLVDSQTRISLTYRFAKNGSCTIYNTFRTYQDVTIDYWSGAVQAPVMGFSARKLWQYVPRLSPIVGSLATYDLSALCDISGTFEQIEFSAAAWTAPLNPPERMAQLVKSTAGANDFGHIIGYSQLRGSGVPSNRVNNINTAGFISAAKKNYLKLVTSGSTAFSGTTSMPAGSFYETVSYRSFFNSALTPTATLFTWYWDGDDIVVVMDFHQTLSFQSLALPSDFIGKKITVIEKTASFTLHSAEIVSADGLLVSVSGGYGYAIIKLS